jgi:uncharacterized protein (TIGR02594 family)
MTEPLWLTKAREYIGLAEIKGPQNNPKILELWKAAKLGGIKNDEIPWCAGFVGGVLEMAGIESTRADSARSYLDWGLKLQGPVVGCIVVFERGAESGHVGFVVARTAKNLLVLGGNQGDKVSIAQFDPARVLAYRWPANRPLPFGGFAELPLMQSNGQPISMNEA